MRFEYRSPWVYRALIAVPLAMGAYLVASGRFGAYLKLFQSMSESAPPSEEAFNAVFATGMLWMGACAPFLIVAWLIGREHVAGRRMGYDIYAGMGEVFRRALRGRNADDDARRAAAFARPPADNPRAALAWGVAAGLGLPAFFAGVMADLRTPAGLVWLGGAGILFGTFVYARRRAVAYLRSEPAAGLFREYAMLAPGRYAPEGRTFVRIQLVAMVLLPVWWLGGGSLLVL